jgi:hypothetical protein
VPSRTTTASSASALTSPEPGTSTTSVFLGPWTPQVKHHAAVVAPNG